MRVLWLLVLSSCTHVVWRQEGATQQQLTTDIYECDHAARMVGEEPDLKADKMTGPVFFGCMVERRWRPVDEDGFRGRGWRQYDLDGT